MSEIIITIRATSDSDEYEESIHEAMKGILAGNQYGRGENNHNAYEFSLVHIHDSAE